MASEQPIIKFMGWDRPGLVSACDELLKRSRVKGELDLSHVAIVVPGSRVGRNLHALLATRAAAAKLPFSPPKVVTTGGIPELVIPATGRIAGEAATRLAWAEALAAEPPETLKSLVPEPPRAGELRAWLALADLLILTERELAAAFKTFADVTPACETMDGFDAARWETAARAQVRAEELLHRRGLCSSHHWRLTHLRHDAKIPPVVSEVVLVGVAELSETARVALRLMGNRVTSLVHSEASDAASLDEFGCPLEAAWTERTLDLPEAAVHFASNPSDQAEAALCELATCGDEFGVDEVAIGIADESLVPTIERVAEQAAGPSVRYSGGTPVKRTGPWKLLRAIAEHLERSELSTLRSLIRHPDMEWRLRHLKADGTGPANESWLARIDRYAEETLHRQLTGEWHTDDAETASTLTWVHATVNGILTPLNDPALPEKRSVGEWADAMLQVLVEIYRTHEPHESSHGDGGFAAACEAIRTAADELRDLTSRGEAWPFMRALDVLRLALELSGDASVPQDQAADAIEMLGWLELPLDPSPCVVVVGMNEGTIPGRSEASALLTESIRRSLGMPESRRRYARDAWVLHTLLKSRLRLLLIAGRQDSKGDPLWPSRLLLAEHPSMLPNRMLRFLGKLSSDRRPMRLRPAVKAGAESLFKAPPEPLQRTVTSMSVTSFQEYIASPYVFYLKYVLGLKERTDPEPDLTHRSFGNLVHKAMQRFAESNAKHATDQRLVEQCLLDELSTAATAMFGPQPSVAVALQIEFARRRLRSIARWQADRTRSGWLIAHNEWKPDDGTAFLVVDGTSMALTGRVDRIERHAESGHLAILDFKTTSKPTKPSDACSKEGVWKDLQLPLYRHLARQLGANDQTQLGYVNISNDPQATPLTVADWSPDQLKQADERAEAVVRAVMRSEFADLGEGPQSKTTLAAICGMNQFNFEPEDDETENRA